MTMQGPGFPSQGVPRPPQRPVQIPPSQSNKTSNPTYEQH